MQTKENRHTDVGGALAGASRARTPDRRVLCWFNVSAPDDSERVTTPAFKLLKELFL
jgi:hypothetical protein